jgi:hypothetical protein
MRDFDKVVGSPTEDGDEEGTDCNPSRPIHSRSDETINELEFEKNGMKVKPMLPFPRVLCSSKKVQY